MAHNLIQPDDWSTLKSRDFANWFSQLQGMRSPVLVGTRSQIGVDNLAIFNSMTHVGARPPHLGLVFRPLTVRRDTYENIKSAGFYTINHITSAFFEQAHQTSGKYQAEINEFEACDLTAEESSQAVSYVKESPLSFLMEFAEEHHIAANDTIFLVGVVREIRINNDLIRLGSNIDWEALNTVVISGLYKYYDVKTKASLPYVSVK